MSNSQSQGQVVLAEDNSALVVLHKLLIGAATTYPEAFVAVGLPADPKTFRRDYPEVLPQFEAARLASANSQEIAGHLVTALQQYVVWKDPTGTRSLADALSQPAEPLALSMHAFEGESGWQASLVYQGQRWDSNDFVELGELLVGRGVVTSAVNEALVWVNDKVLEAGTLRLTGRKIAVLGAGAEMAPTRLWLESGADVLWLDTQPPPRSWWDTPGMSGRLFWPQDNVDLLTNPQDVLATLVAFADGEPLDLGLYAYAPGQARELRLTASMNAIVNALPGELVGSVTMLVSPTTPTAMSFQDRQAMQARIQARPAWEAICAGTGLLGGGGGCVELGDAAATRTVVSIQGASYQAAQYLGKILMAQYWASHGQLAAASPQPLRVSANTAAITRTRSLSHPVFKAAFGGAAALGVETMAPRQSRRINGLLAVHDWLQADLPIPGVVRVHGGIHTLPYPLGAALRVAAAIGFARSPRLLGGLFGR